MRWVRLTDLRIRLGVYPWQLELLVSGRASNPNTKASQTQTGERLAGERAGARLALIRPIRQVRNLCSLFDTEEQPDLATGYAWKAFECGLTVPCEFESRLFRCGRIRCWFPEAGCEPVSRRFDSARSPGSVLLHRRTACSWSVLDRTRLCEGRRSGSIPGKNI